MAVILVVSAEDASVLLVLSRKLPVAWLQYHFTFGHEDMFVSGVE